MSIGDFSMYQNCCCSLPREACKTCSSNPSRYSSNPNMHSNFGFPTYTYPYKTTKKIETWEGDKHTVEEWDECGNYKKTATEEFFDENKKLIKRIVTEETSGYPTFQYNCYGNGTTTTACFNGYKTTATANSTLSDTVSVYNTTSCQ